MIESSTVLTIVGLAITILTTLFGVIFKRLNDMDDRLRQAPTRREVSEEIEVRIETVRVLQKEIKEDIKEIKESIKDLAKNK